MTIKLRIYLLFFILFSFFDGFSNVLEDGIKLTINVTNELDGTKIQDAEITVTERVGGRLIKPSIKGQDVYYLLSEGKDVKIKVKAQGFYLEERTLIGSELNDNDVLNIKMSRKAGGSILVKVIDKETQAVVESEMVISYFSSVINRKFNETSPQYTYYYDLKGKYKFETKAKGYLNDAREIEYDISNDSKVENLVIELVKNREKLVLEIIDGSSNSKIESGTVTVVHNKTSKKIFNGKVENGTVSFDGNKNDIYAIEIVSEGFSTLKKQVTMTSSVLRIELIQLTAYEIDIFEKESEKRLIVNLEIINPKGQKNIIKSSDLSSIKYFPTDIGTYTITAKQLGYLIKSGTFIVKTLDGGTSFYTLRLEKGSSEFELSVFDFDTKLPIDDAEIKIFNDQSKELSGKKDKNKLVVEIDKQKKYFFEITAKTYADFTANISEEKSQQVFLKKKQVIIPVKYEFEIVDFQSKQKIKEAKFRVFDSTGKGVPMTFDALSQKFLTDKLDSTKSYSYEASAKGYNAVKEDFNLKDKTKSIGLTLAGIKTYGFEFKDAITQKIVNGDLRLTLDEKELEVTKKSDKYSSELAVLKNVKVFFENKDYQKLEKSLIRDLAINDVFGFDILKLKYTVSAKFIPELTQSLINSASIKIKEKGEEVYINLMSNANSFGFEAKPNVIYDVVIEVEGFEKFKDSYILSTEFKNKINYEVKLDNKTLVKVAEKSDVKAEPQVIVKKEEKQPIVKEKITGIKTVAAGEDINNFGALKSGTKYKLSKVGFEQSKTKLTTDSYPELEQLVQYLKDKPNMWIEITGHSDNEGNDQRLNQRLSEFRAKAVSNFLFNKGIKPDRISVFGKGSLEPVAENTSEENRAKNRRVEIVLTEN